MLSYVKRLQRLGVTSLEQRKLNLRGDLTETYKIITGKEKVSCSKFFKLYMYISKPQHLQALLQAGHHEKSPRNTQEFLQPESHHWNRLSDKVVEASTVNIFKNRLDLNSHEMA